MTHIIISLFFLLLVLIFKDINEHMINYSQTPWYQKWYATNNNFVCSVNKHLQRKCSWICDETQNP